MGRENCWKFNLRYDSDRPANDSAKRPSETRRFRKIEVACDEMYMELLNKKKSA